MPVDIRVLHRLVTCTAQGVGSGLAGPISCLTSMPSRGPPQPLNVSDWIRTRTGGRPKTTASPANQVHGLVTEDKHSTLLYAHEGTWPPYGGICFIFVHFIYLSRCLKGPCILPFFKIKSLRNWNRLGECERRKG